MSWEEPVKVVRPSPLMVRTAAVMVLAGVVMVPDVGAARPWQQADDGGGAAQVQIDIDVQTADSTSLETAAGVIGENVETQIDALIEAEGTLAGAEARLILAGEAVQETEDEIAILSELSDEVVIRAFMNPPAETAVEVITTDSAGDAALKRVLLKLRAEEDADVLTALAASREELVVRQEAEEEALTGAESARALAHDALVDLQAGASQQALFVVEVEQRIERGLTEVETLAEVDPELSDELREAQEELVGVIDQLQVDLALELAGVPPPADNHVGGSSTIEPVGSMVVVSCPTGGSIQVAGDISRGLQSLLNLSAEQGLTMCGTGWRSTERQIELRRRHCGSSEYAIYQAPASACSPPTARPGQSMHERALAVDFTCNGRGVSSGDACFAFLRNNASTYGFYNLPSEPWHWSVDGN